MESIYTDDSLPSIVTKNGLPFYFVRWIFDGAYFSPIFSDDILSINLTRKTPGKKQDEEEEEEEGDEGGKERLQRKAKKKVLSTIETREEETDTGRTSPQGTICGHIVQ